MNNKVMKFALTPQEVRIKEILNGDFLRITVRAISDVNPNRNNSHFTLKAMEDAVQNGNFYNRPVLGNFKKETNDFGGHDDGGLHYDSQLDELYYSYDEEDCERPIGIIRESDRVELVWDEKEQVHWIEYDAVIWTKYSFRAVKKLLSSKSKKNKISVEVEVLDSEIRDDGIEEILKFNYLGTTLLGNHLVTGIQNAELTLLDKIESSVFQKKQRALAFAYDALDKATGKVESPVNQGSNIIDDLTKENKISNDFSADGCVVEVDINEAPVEEITMQNQESQEGGNQDVLNLGKEKSTENFEEEKPIDSKEEEACENKGCESEVCDSKECEAEDCDSKECEADTEPEDKSNDEGEEKPENKDDNKETESVCDSKECEAESSEEEKECGNFEESEDGAENDSDEEPKEEECGNFEEEKECGNFEDDKKDEKECGTFAASIELNEEPQHIDVEGKSMTEIVETATESIAAPAAVSQETSPQLGDANASASSVLASPDCPVVEAIVNDSVIASTSVSVGPDGQQATVVSSDPVEVDEPSAVEQPDDDAKAANFSAVDRTVNVDGEDINIDSLLEKYNSLYEKYTTMVQDNKTHLANQLAQFGADFINADDFADDSTKQSFISQVSEKCANFELSSEEEVTNFSKSLLAMYYYENKVSKKDKTEDFSLPITPSAHIETVSHNKLRDAINKLNNL